MDNKPVYPRAAPGSYERERIEELKKKIIVLETRNAGLLEALKACEDAILAYQARGSRTDREALNTACEEARAAIAKARGE